MKNFDTSGKPSSRSEDGLLNSAASSRPRSMAGTISPPGRIVTEAPISLNRPAERRARHREVEEALQIELQNFLHQFFVQCLAAAVVEPAEEAMRVPAKGRRGAEQRIGLV